MISRFLNDIFSTANTYTDNSTFNLLPVFILVLVLFSIQAEAQTGIHSQGEIEIEPTGALWLEGSTSVVDYRCYAEKLDGAGILANTNRPALNIQGEGEVALEVTLPVRALKCGREKMDRDMYEALKADEHPNITYRLMGAQQQSESSHPDSVGWMNIEAHGLLSIAGVTDTTKMTIQGQPIGRNRFRIKGSFPLNMGDFNVTPPTALLGLIRASEELTVHFDVSVLLR